MITPTKIKRWPRDEVEQHATQLLARVGLSHRLGAYPDQLSGGQQQRVAIARALALKPKILFLDEITAALDPELVNEVLKTIRELSSEGITMLRVSHEMSFVREVSSRVVFMADAHIVESGTPHQIFDAPLEAVLASLSARSCATEGRPRLSYRCLPRDGQARSGAGFANAYGRRCVLPRRHARDRPRESPDVPLDPLRYG